MNKQIGTMTLAAAFALCGPSWASAAGQAQLTPRAAADAFLNRAELLRIKYHFPNHEKQALDDLLAGRYDALEADLNKAEADFERDASYEFAFYDVLYAVADCDGVSPQREAAIKAWVAARPKSAWAHLMLGRYYSFASCEARSIGGLGDVADDQRTKMSDSHSQSFLELQKAQQLEPKHLAIYTSLVGLSRTESDADGMRQGYEAGRKLFPTSFNLPSAYMEGLRPRWGGSREAMQRLADSLKTETRQNPLFWVLQGSADADQGHTAYQDGDPGEALAHFKAALRYGDQGPWLIETARIEMALHDSGSALQYYRRNEIYEQDLRKQIETEEGQLISYCFSNQDKCKTDPKDFPWFGEPELPNGTPAP